MDTNQPASFSRRPLTFRYDEGGDILFVGTGAPHAEQESDELGPNLVVRRNPDTGVVESLEALFVTKSSFQYADSPLERLGELFAAPAKAPMTRERSSR